MKLPKGTGVGINPKRGEIWRADLEPTVGAEIQKNNRPVLVLSIVGVGARTIRICAPITDYSPLRDEDRYWRVAVGDGEESGLVKTSCADMSQTRALDISRLTTKVGKAHPTETQTSAEQLAISVGAINALDESPDEAEPIP